MKVLSSLLALLAVLPCAAQARTAATSNESGGGVLLEQVLTQRARPLFAATREPSGAFGPLRAIAPPGDFDEQQVAIDDSGGAVAMWRRYVGVGVPERLLVATRAPGGGFGRPRLLSAEDAAAPLLAMNRRGDAMVVWGRVDKPALYSFRPAGGAFSAPVAIPGAIRAYALALDGDGGAFLVWAGGTPGLKSAYRPPGGSFGPPQPVPGPSPAVATDRDGDMLLAWVEGRALMTAERPAGSVAFEPHSPVVSGLGETDTIDALAVSAGGDAAIAYGTSPLKIVVRHAGAWTDPQRLPVGRHAIGFRMAMNRRGDAALSWASAFDRVVHAAYRVAGSTFGMQRRLSAARPGAPGETLFRPGLTIDGTGRATVTWEESDGEHVSVYARDFDERSARARTRVARLRAYQREGPASACRPSWARVVKSTRQATVLVGTRGGAKDLLYGCLLARGSPVELFGEYGFFPPIALAGPLVGYASDSCDLDECVTFVSVTDLRDPIDGLNRVAVLSPSEVPALVVNRHGALAWVSCTAFNPAYGAIHACTAKSRKRKRVYALDRRSYRLRLLQVSRRIVPKSLTLHGSRLSWLDGRRHRAARLH